MAALSKQRVTIDTFIQFLDRYPTSLPGAILLTLASFFRARSKLDATAGPFSPLSLFDHIKGSTWLYRLVLFTGVKSVNRALNRLVVNHGWKADPPRWNAVKGKGDVVLITGGAAGIGKELVELLSKKTSKIAVLDVSPPTYLAKNVKYYKCDITNPAAIKEVGDRIRSEIGHPTIIVNNAGILRGNTLLETSMSEFELTYKVNVLGAHNILREFLPHIISINHGHVMTTASSAAYFSIAQLGEYSCSKAAALALHETLNAELVHRYNAPKVRTSVICPTKVYTSLGDSLSDGDNQFLTPTLQPKWLATQMLRIIESGLSDHLVAPNSSHLLPLIRSSPEWFRYLLSLQANDLVSNERNKEVRKTYTIAGKLLEGTA